MAKMFFAFLALLFICAATAQAGQKSFETDRISTSKGDLLITFIGHGTLMMKYGGKVLYIDPVSQEADYSTMLKADIILVTHEHGDHLDAKAIDQISTSKTGLIVTKSVFEKIKKGTVMKNGDNMAVQVLKIEAVPAYNLVHMRSPGVPYHPKGVGNGYIITFGDKRVYVAGDTENTPEMKALKGIDIAFLPMNLPYTMTPEMVADAAKSFRPKILYPYHYGNTDTKMIVELLKNDKDIEVRIRNMK